MRPRTMPDTFIGGWRMIDIPLLYDTIAAYYAPTAQIQDDLFQGGSVSENFTQKNVTARLWHNPTQDHYAPRITYWRSHGTRSGRTLGQFQPNLPVLPSGVSTDEGVELDGFPYGLLKCEFSVSKMLSHNPEQSLWDSDKSTALNKVHDYVRMHIDKDAPHPETWMVNRIDYAFNWDVKPYLPAYMAVLQNLRLGSMSRHPFDASEGVVWKAANRWVKFYNKSLEAGLKGTQILRYEVSNYKDGVRYIASDWFNIPRTIGSLCQPNVAIYVLSYVWDKLGLGRADHYGTEELLDYKLRDFFGGSVAAAHWALRMIQRYGTSAYSDEQGLMGKANYYKWMKKLKSAGLLTTVTSGEGVEQHVVVHEALSPLHLPLLEVVAGAALAREVVIPSAPSHKDAWKILQEILGISSKTESRYMIERFADGYSEYERIRRLGQAGTRPAPTSSAPGAIGETSL